MGGGRGGNGAHSRMSVWGRGDILGGLTEMGVSGGLTGVQEQETKEMEHKVGGELQGGLVGRVGGWGRGVGGGGGGFIQIIMRLLFSFLI